VGAEGFVEGPGGGGGGGGRVGDDGLVGEAELVGVAAADRFLAQTYFMFVR
jgi:hypothetical protein